MYQKHFYNCLKENQTHWKLLADIQSIIERWAQYYEKTLNDRNYKNDRIIKRKALESEEVNDQDETSDKGENT